jgi:hypothetical protein|tara:strand:- start:1069 stop:1824 length:756 start_codon:yes stop_codon:yes gene_type:complete
MKYKILELDIENAPNAGYMWGLWKQDIPVAMLEEQWYILTWAAKWLGEGKVMGATLQDQNCLSRLWKLLDQADLVIAHNGDKFDIPKINTYFILNDLSPPSPYRTVDTLKVARKHFAFASNRLDDLGLFLGVGRKRKNDGFELWKRCMAGEKKAFKEMLAYNIDDVTLLEAVYLTLRPYMNNHPNLGMFGELEGAECPSCGSSELVQNGYYRTNVSKFQRYTCKDCGNPNIRGRLNLLTKEEKENLVTNAR